MASKPPASTTSQPTLHFTLADGTTIVGRPTSLARVLALAIAGRTHDGRHRKQPPARKRRAA